MNCPEAKRYEAYDWCLLSDNICIQNTGNPDLDVDCENFPNMFECKVCGNEFEMMGNGHVPCPYCKTPHFVFGDKQKEIKVY